MTHDEVVGLVSTAVSAIAAVTGIAQVLHSQKQLFPLISHIKERLFTRRLRSILRAFMGENLAENFLGDLGERRTILVKKQGRHQADRWYRRQLLISIPPLLVLAIRRLASHAVRSLTR